MSWAKASVDAWACRYGASGPFALFSADRSHRDVRAATSRLGGSDLKGEGLTANGTGKTNLTGAFLRTSRRRRASRRRTTSRRSKYARAGGRTRSDVVAIRSRTGRAGIDRRDLIACNAGLIGRPYCAALSPQTDQMHRVSPTASKLTGNQR